MLSKCGRLYLLWQRYRIRTARELPRTFSAVREVFLGLRKLVRPLRPFLNIGAGLLLLHVASEPDL